MAELSEGLKKEAAEAFFAYEEVVVNRLMNRPGWKLDAAPLERVLRSGDEATVRAFVVEMQLARASILSSVVVRTREVRVEGGRLAPALTESAAGT